MLWATDDHRRLQPTLLIPLPSLMIHVEHPFPDTNLALGLLGFLLLHQALDVQARSIVNPGFGWPNKIADMEEFEAQEEDPSLEGKLAMNAFTKDVALLGKRGDFWCLSCVLLRLLLESEANLNPVCPTACVCLPSGQVKCMGDITEIPPLATETTFHLVLQNTKITVLKDRCLESLVLTLRFALHYSPLDLIQPEAFKGASQLKSLSLSYDALSHLPPRVFGELSNLQELFLRGNQLTSISSSMFEGLGNLTELDISHNRIAHLDSDAFRSLGNLGFLNLARNMLTHLPRDVFHNLKELRQLHLHYNQLQTLEAGSFDQVHKLRELQLFNNQIRSIPPRLFWNVPNLSTLTLSRNMLQYIPEESFYYMPSLVKLTIYDNPLLSLPDQLMGHMPKMEVFYLYETNLTTVPWNLFANMTGLKILNFHLNYRLSFLPKDVFCCLPNLQTLSLKQNSLDDLHPDVFSSLTSLTDLLLHDNKLRSLPVTIFHNLSKLKRIELKNNLLRNLPGDVFAGSSILANVTLGGNPWNCNCSIIGIAEWTSENRQLVKDNAEVLCHEPLNLQNHTLSSITYDFLNCDSTTTIRAPSTPATTIATTEGRRKMLTTPSLKAKSTDPLTTTPKSVTTPFASTVPFSTALSASTPKSVTTPFTSRVSLSTSISTNVPSDGTAEDIFEIVEVVEAFDKVVVLDEGRSHIIHNNHHNGWVYLWTVPSRGTISGLLMALHIVLVATGVVLIVATLYALYRLDQELRNLGTLSRLKHQKITYGRWEKFHDKL
ncbi:platelet glycoprotein V [Chanos chanos]|uniref:Platelet glycoprotein V n=1 Tax=Chanos chanos TaxID=29144 RepID=A0A6J2W416_CHACN|nr:platelet glycoprotein V-like [Chanos chanos]